MKKTEEEKVFELPNKKVVVKPNFNNPGWIKNPRHAAFWKLEGAYDGFTCAMQRNGQLKNPFSKAEIATLSEQLFLDPKELSVYNRDGLIATRIVRLNKDPRVFNLADPQDYFDLKILLTNEDKVAPSVKDKTKKATYKYYIEDQDDLDEVKATTATISQQAWKEYGKMEEDAIKLISFLKVYGQIFNKVKKVDANSKLAFLQGQVVDIINENMKAFVEVVTSDEFDTILLISDAISAGVIKQDGRKYYFENEQLGTGGLTEAISFISATTNQTLLLTIQERTKKAKK